MPLPMEHPYTLTKRDTRRSITRLEHLRDTQATEEEKSEIDGLLKPLNEAMRIVTNLEKDVLVDASETDA